MSDYKSVASRKQIKLKHTSLGKNVRQPRIALLVTMIKYELIKLLSLSGKFEIPTLVCVDILSIQYDVLPLR